MMSKFSAMALPVDVPARMTILHPGTRQPLVDPSGEAAWIDLISLDSKEAQAFDTSELQKRADQRGRSANIITEAEQVTVRKYALLTKGWHLVGWDGEVIDLPCTETNAIELYSDNTMRWVRDQVDVFVANRANFLPRSSKN
jgi:hypothetical protein